MLFPSSFFFLQHNSNDVGEVFQDEKNMAAILMRRHMETGDLIMVSGANVNRPAPHTHIPRSFCCTCSALRERATRISISADH